jgi:kynureninase
VAEGAKLLAEAGIGRLRDKGVALTEYLIMLADAWLAPLGCAVASPRDPARRGSHVCVYHPEGRRVYQALKARGVLIDYRAPDRMRFGPAPITTRFSDVWHAVDTTRQILESQAYQEFPAA